MKIAEGDLSDRKWSSSREENCATCVFHETAANPEETSDDAATASYGDTKASYSMEPV